MGVRRAVEIAEEEAIRAKDNGKTVYTLGPLIHNPKVLKDLKQLGINQINNEQLINNKGILKNYSVVIRAHGISPEIEKTLYESGCNVVDATCPKVKANQLKIEELSEEGYSFFLAGEEKHAEVEGLLGFAKNAPFCVVIGSADEAKRQALSLKDNPVLLKHDKKIALLGQTTISEEEYRNIENEIKKFFPNLKTVNTICTATHERQMALKEILNDVNAVIVAGGEDSANTRRLLAIAKESGKPCVIAQDADSIPDEFFSYNTIGLCSGASTPDSVVDEIERVLYEGRG